KAAIKQTPRQATKQAIRQTTEHAVRATRAVGSIRTLGPLDRLNFDRAALFGVVCALGTIGATGLVRGVSSLRLPGAIGRLAAFGLVGTSGSFRRLGTISTVGAFWLLSTAGVLRLLSTVGILRFLSALGFVSAFRTVGPGTLVVGHVLDRATFVRRVGALLTPATRSSARRRGGRLRLLVAGRRFIIVGLGPLASAFDTSSSAFGSLPSDADWLSCDAESSSLPATSPAASEGAVASSSPCSGSVTST